MNEQGWRNRSREVVKLGVRSRLGRLNLDLARDPYANRLARALQSAQVDTVLDIGANVGQFARLLRSAGFAGNIVSVEPLSRTYAELAKRAARDPQWSTVNAAVGSDSGQAVINIAANSYSSSLLPMTAAHLDAAPDSDAVGTELVQVIGVPELLSKFSVDPARTLLKVDTQGYEGQVLESAGDLLGQFAAVQLELSFVELYVGQSLFDELVAKLRGHGLQLWSFDPGISDASGRLLQCDGLFMRLS